MKKKENLVFASILIIFILFIILYITKNNGEHYITDNEKIYDIAIDYIKEEEYRSNTLNFDRDSYHFFVSYDGLGITEKGKYKYAYMWILGESYYLENNEQKSDHGYSMFFKFTIENNKVIKYQNPEDGSYYVKSINKMCIDKKMKNKIINYNSKLSNEENIKAYYSKISDSKQLKKEDIIGDDGLLFNISYRKDNCIPILLSVYDNDKYELSTQYESCETGKICASMLKYLNKVEGKYNYDIMSIIKNSLNADDMIFTNDKRAEYEIYTGNGEIVYMMITDNSNKYLKEFLESIDINLHTCAELIYK